MGYQFKPRLSLTLVTILAIILFVKLGTWQLSRAEEKETQFALLEQYAKQPPVSIPATSVKLDDYLYRQVEVRGNFAAEHTILLDNKLHQGIVGYHVLTPLQLLNSSMHVMINRGWVAGDSDRSILPEVFTPTEQVVITGIVDSPWIKALSLSDEQIAANVWQNFDLDLYQSQTSLTLQPLLLLQQDSEIEDGLIRQWKKPDSGSSKNIGYAFQWFSLAVATLIIYLVLNVKRKGSN